MKKLLITTMAAVSVGLCAKADLTAETFESYSEGSLFGTYTDEEDGVEKYRVLDGWYTEPTLENLFTVTNIANYVGSGTYPESSDSVKALAIDTSAPLLRYADSSKDPQSLSDAPIFFDSVVQFTATDVAPSMENNTTDKLAVWLYVSPDSLADGVFEETEAKTNLVITAGEWVDGSLKTKHYLTDKVIEPDSWHRLTIKSFVENDFDKFNVWVDGTPVVVEEVDAFDSLIDAQNTKNGTKLQGVAFDGKGAVDDIVFTTTDPFAGASYEVTISLSQEADVEGAVISAQYKLDSGEYNELALSGTLTLPETTTDFTAKLWISDGAKLVGGTKKADEEDNGNYAWYISYDAATFKKDGTDTITFEVVADGGTEDPITTYAVSVTPNAQATVGGLSAEYAEGNVVTFTVVAATGYTIESVVVAGASTRPDLTPSGNGYSFTMPAEAVTITVTTKAIEEEVTYPSVGGVETPEYSDNAKAAIDAAFPENSYPTGGLTVKVNGETLTGAPAVAMLNEAVEMFILAGDAKFFDEDGVMDISFKATNPLMETETAEATDYEAKVGEATATVTSNYTVNKETVDLTPGVAGENEAVTFKLVIKPAGSTGSDAGSAVQE
ncbi:MAG: hypothetical protein IKL02_04885 [Kiritimatiellae bacterium]|nr:hypothetical protein [Kiritimatiellia bacterium]